jgi:uncharacterized protein (TIGR04255 family)
VLVRAFLLPAGAAYDPSVPLSKSRSWLLDIDAADVSNQPFEASALGSTASRLADRCHSVFRWSVTEAFLDRFR